MTPKYTSMIPELEAFLIDRERIHRSDEFFKAPDDDPHTAKCSGWQGMRQRFADGEIRCFDCGEVTPQYDARIDGKHTP